MKTNSGVLSDDIIFEEAQSFNACAQGVDYSNRRAVQSLTAAKDELTFTAKVTDASVYVVEVVFRADYAISDYSCTCQAYVSYNRGACKHIVAVLLDIRKWLQDNNKISTVAKVSPSVKANKRPQEPVHKQLTDYPVRALLNQLSFFDDDNPVAAPEDIWQDNIEHEFVPIFQYSNTSYTNNKNGSVKFFINNGKQHRIKDLARFVEVMNSSRETEYEISKSLIVNSRRTRFSARSLPLLNWLRAVATDRMFEKGEIALTPYWQELLFQILLGRTFAVEIGYLYHGPAEIVEGNPKVGIKILNVPGGVSLTAADQRKRVSVISSKNGYVFYNKYIYRVDPRLIGLYEQLDNVCYSGNSGIVAEADLGRLFGSALERLKLIADIDQSQFVMGKYKSLPLFTAIYLTAERNSINARIEARYGTTKLNPLTTVDQVPTENGKKFLRDSVGEQQIERRLTELGFVRQGDIMRLTDDTHTYSFLKFGIEALGKYAEVFADEKLLLMKPRQPHPLKAGVRIEGNLLSMDVDYGDADFAELRELLVALKLKKRFVRVKSGAFVDLDNAELNEFGELLDNMHVAPESVKSAKIALPKRMALYLDAMTRNSERVPLERNADFDKLITDIRSPQVYERKLPRGIKATLRGYQETGYKWLSALAEYGFGGILADDMGLGKTLQAILLIKANDDKKHRQSLIVAPASLIYNWQAEIEKFAPAMKTLVMYGAAKQREDTFDKFKEYDVIITTYGLLRSDVDKYESFTFKYCFIDEAQHIKNPKTLNAKAVKSIQALSCFALTGTPMENTLTELWSIFDFLMPGYLYSHAQFAARLEKPIMVGNQKAADELRQKISPFIMRRLKSDVLRELPDKIVSLSYNEMTGEQRKIYLAHMALARKELDAALDQKGYASSQIVIITLLTRLRQLCCHPGLFIDKYHGGSGKLDQLLEIIDDSLSGGHRMLIFSQFTSMHDHTG
ncbi:MAG: SNF2 helicase associated domain-containing protein [Bacillota bacterium]